MHQRIFGQASHGVFLWAAPWACFGERGIGTLIEAAERRRTAIERSRQRPVKEGFHVSDPGATRAAHDSITGLTTVSFCRLSMIPVNAAHPWYKLPSTVDNS